MSYREFQRAMTEQERAAALAAQAQCEVPIPAVPKLQDAKRRALIRAAMILLAVVLAFWLLWMGTNAATRGDLPIAAALVLAPLSVMLWRGAQTRIREAAAEERYGAEMRERERRHWADTLRDGVVSVVRIETRRFAQVLPNAPSQPPYYFSDLGEEGVFCTTGGAARPCSAFELSGYERGRLTNFVCLGAPLEPELTLRWSDFESSEKSTAAESYRPFFPEHGARYPIAFDNLRKLFELQRDRPEILWANP